MVDTLANNLIGRNKAGFSARKAPVVVRVRQQVGPVKQAPPGCLRGKRVGFGKRRPARGAGRLLMSASARNPA